MKNTREILQKYCATQSLELSALAGMPGTYLTDGNYVAVRNGIYMSVPREYIGELTYELTMLLALVSHVGYPES